MAFTGEIPALILTPCTIIPTILLCSPISELSSCEVLFERNVLQCRVFLWQVATLKDQLAKEIQKKQSYITRTAQKSDEIRDLRGKLEDSLNTVARDTIYEPAVLERESHKLEDSVDASYSTSPMRRTKSASPPVRFPGDKMTTSTPAYSGISPSRRTTPISSSMARRGTGVSPLRKTRKSTT